MPALSFGLMYGGALTLILVCVRAVISGNLYKDAEKAQELRKRGRPEEAVEVMEAAVRRSPDDAILLSDFGAALFEAGHEHEAERQFRKAYAIDSRLAEAAYGIGHCLLASNVAEAENYFTEAMKLDPKMAPAVQGRGVARFTAGRLAEAAEDFEAACTLRRDWAKAQMNAGVVATALGDLQTAEHKFREAVRLAPVDPLALSNLGSLLGATGQHEEAARILERAVAVNPGAIKERVELAHLLRREGKRIDAITNLADASRLAPDNADVFFRLAMLQDEVGRKQDAEKTLKRAEAIDPRLAGGLSMNQREMIAALPIFAGMNEEDVRRVMAAGRARNVADGQSLVTEGDPADTVCIVEDGTFAVRKKTIGTGGTVLCRLGKGSLVGEMAFFDRGRRSATVVADGAAKAIEIPFAAIDAFVAEKASAGQILLRNFARILSDRLRHLDDESRDRLHWGVVATMG